MAEIIVEKEWTKEPAGRRIFGNFIESGFGRQVNGMWSEMLYNRAQTGEISKLIRYGKDSEYFRNSPYFGFYRI